MHTSLVRHTAALLMASLPLAATAQQCAARSGPRAATVVELYTSEGCNSCPPADHWLSMWKADPSAVALAFHVDYWDHLGWVDRFASADYTQRQAQQRVVNGARYSYTPQVVIDGVDRGDWMRVDAAARADATSPSQVPVQLSLERRGNEFLATVQALRPLRLAAYWAVTEDQHLSAVKAGENAGVTLLHDNVVRELRTLAAWQAQPGVAVPLQFSPSTPRSADHPRKIKLVVIDVANGRPLQALSLGC